MPQSKTAHVATANEEEMPLTFDDIPLYTYVVYRGRGGFVIKKGEDVSSAVSGEHMLVEFIDRDLPEHKQEAKIRDSLVNRLLKKNEKLFVDFTNSLAFNGTRPR